MPRGLKQVVKWYESTQGKVIVGIIGLIATLVRILPMVLSSPDNPNWLNIVATVFIVGSVLVLLVSFVVSYSNNSEVNEDQRYRETIQQYGLGYENVSVVCAINEHGGAKVKYRIRATAYRDISQLESYLEIPEELPSSNQRDVIETTEAEITRRADYGSERNFFHKTTDVKERMVSSFIDLDPIVPAGTEVESTFYFTLPDGLYSINEPREIYNQRSTQYDYFGWNIRFPTKKLEIEIEFPNSFEPTAPRADVCFSQPTLSGKPPRRRLQEQYSKLRQPRHQEGRHRLTLDVDFPLVGLVYFVTWDAVHDGIGSEPKRI